MTQIVTVSGDVLVMQPSGRPAEQHRFSTAESAERRARFISEGLSWIGTPFVDCADIKGPKGGTDCAMMLVRSAVDPGLLPPFDPRPYSPRHMLHSGEEKFLGWMTDRLGAVEVPREKARVGDVLVYQFGRSFCHGAILISSTEVVHAYKGYGFCTTTRLVEPLLTHIGVNGLGVYNRPVKAFTLWGD